MCKRLISPHGATWEVGGEKEEGFSELQTAVFSIGRMNTELPGVSCIGVPILFIRAPSS